MRRALVASSLGALLLAAPAAAHVTVKPSFVAAQHSQRFVFSSPNERSVPMTGFSLTVPDGFRILRAAHQPTRHPIVFGPKVTWVGRALATNQTASFAVELEGPAKPGRVTIRADQLYPTGAVETWPLAFTVVPGTKPAQHLGRAALVAVVGLLATVLFVVVRWRRPRRRLAGES